MRKNINKPLILFISSLILLASAVASFVYAVSVENDLDFGSTYSILNASTTTILGGLSVGTSTLQSPGVILAPNGLKFADASTQTTAGVGSLGATNISASVFGSTAGKGNYTFQEATSASSTLFVDATNGRVGIGTSAPTLPLTVNGSVIIPQSAYGVVLKDPTGSCWTLSMNTTSSLTTRQADCTTGALVTYPSLLTTEVSSITESTATGGGNITSDGGSSVTSRGVCYSTSQNPTTPCTSDGTGTGVFTSSLSGLSGNTTYYARAYATNSAGTAYGSQISFTTAEVLLTYSGATHTPAQCTSAGGSVVNVGTTLCQFNASSCPSGWSQAGSWSTTSNNSTGWNQPATSAVSITCNGYNYSEVAHSASSGTLNSGSHGWSNQGQESNSCTTFDGTYYIFYQRDTGCSETGIGYLDISQQTATCTNITHANRTYWTQSQNNWDYYDLNWNWGTASVSASVTQIGCK